MTVESITPAVIWRVIEAAHTFRAFLSFIFSFTDMKMAKYLMEIILISYKMRNKQNVWSVFIHFFPTLTFLFPMREWMWMIFCNRTKVALALPLSTTTWTYNNDSPRNNTRNHWKNFEKMEITKSGNSCVRHWS